MSLMNKKNYSGKILAGGVLSAAASFYPAASSFAASCGSTPTFFNWGCPGGTGEQITPVLKQILNWLAVGVTIAVIGGVIYGAVLYTSSGGNQEQAKKAMGIIRNAVVALVMYFAMFAFLNWLVPGGLFN